MVIDLHCHILPGIDDGAADLADAIAMARQGAADGIGVVCATPHIRHDHDVRIGELRERSLALEAALRDHGIPVAIQPAGEVAETVLDHLDDAELGQVALGGRWVLLEPAPGPLGDSLHEACERLAARGYRPILAHPERHLTHDLPERLATLIGDGALVQSTAAHVADDGPLGDGMRELAERGLIHVLGSDAHSASAGRPVRLSDGVERLQGIDRLAPHVEWIAELAPAALLAGREVTPPYSPA